MTGCSGCLAVLPFKADHPLTTDQQSVDNLKIARELELPLAIQKEEGVILNHELVPRAKSIALNPENTQDELQSFTETVLQSIPSIRPYAFFIGRLESDFRQAREAIRTVVENEAGIPCLWIDDGRHKAVIEEIREQTRLLIENAEFVIADFTLGIENPNHENPSRAHEVGMALTYGKPMLLCSQEPRRVPYYTISDMQMHFWSTEQELESAVRNWVSIHRETIGRTVYNYKMDIFEASYQPRIKSQDFKYDPQRRYIGPHTNIKAARNNSIIAATIGCFAFTLFFLLMRHLPFFVSLGVALTSGLALGILTWAGMKNVRGRIQAPRTIIVWLLLSIAAISVLVALATEYHTDFGFR
jgi:hypothetical protein